MTIPSVIQGTVEVEGKVFELDSSKGAAWVKTIGSFRFEPSGDGKAYTVRKEASGYWYGCRKIAGKVRKKYIGKSSEVSLAKLEEIAAALEVPPVASVNKVAEVAQEVTQVAEVAQDRLTALELEVASLRKALEALEEKLPGKLELGDSVELPKVDNEVAEELQKELSNLKAENEHLRQKLVESRDTVETLNWGTEALKEQLEAVQAENQRLQNNLGNSQSEARELRSQLVELSDLKQKSATASKDLPEAAEILNQLKAKRKKSKTDLADVEVILEILES
jgi:chromosome segregation ATPase